MQTYVSLPYEHQRPLPDGLDSEVRTPPALVEYAIERFSDPGDVVFDPFAGFGTTLRVAERLNRSAHGIEFEADRVAAVRDTVEHPDRLRQGDALDLPVADLPSADLCYCSPPFMVEGMERNPFENYAGESDYETYLEDIQTVFEGVAELLRPDGTAVVEIVNMKYDGDVTRLAWDVADALADVFHFDGETVVTWEDSTPDGQSSDRVGNFGYGFDHSYLLVFSPS